MQTKTNCLHVTPANDICFVCPIVFDWQRMPAIPHTYSATINGFVIGRYDQPSDGSTWISITGPAGKPCPYTPKKFPDRISAELWAADTVRLLSMAPTETSMTPDNEHVPSNEPTGPAPGEPKPPGQQPPFDPATQPKDDEPNVPGPDFEEGDDDDLDDGSTGFDDEDEDDED